MSITLTPEEIELSDAIHNKFLAAKQAKDDHLAWLKDKRDRARHEHNLKEKQLRLSLKDKRDRARHELYLKEKQRASAGF
jgi:hypothetical protein